MKKENKLKKQQQKQQTHKNRQKYQPNPFFGDSVLDDICHENKSDG